MPSDWRIFSGDGGMRLQRLWRRWLIAYWAQSAGFISVLVAVLVCSFIWAISYPPLPSGGPVVEHNQPEASTERQESNASQRGTEQNPFAIKILPPAKGTPEAERNEKESHEKAANERGVAIATWGLIYATLALFAAAIVQICLFYWQLRLIGRTVKDGAKAANAALENAEAAKKQADAIIKSERPYVFLKNTNPGVHWTPDGQLEFADRRMKFRLINCGKTPALLHEFMEKYVVLEGTVDPPAPLDPLKDRGRLLPDNQVSAPGLPQKWATNLSTKLDGFEKMLATDAWKIRRMIFQGFIRYSDPFDIHHIMGFLFVFVPQGNVWVPFGDEKYNYSRIERPEDIPPHPGYPKQDKKQS